MSDQKKKMIISNNKVIAKNTVAKNPKIDLVVLERVSKLNCTNKELGYFFDIDPGILSTEPYVSIIRTSKEEIKQRLKQKAIDRALTDNSDTMLIFALKNYCGWSNNEKVEMSVTTPQPTLTLVELYQKLQPTKPQDEQ